MPYEIVITRQAQKDLDNLPRPFYIRIANLIDSLADEPRPHGCIKLVNRGNLWRVRVGDYRIVYSIFDDVLTVEIVRVGNRRNVYD